MSQLEDNGEIVLALVEVRKWLEEDGFTVTLVSLKAPPDHVANWPAPFNDVAEMDYFHVETKEGNFGIILYPVGFVIDLTGTGVTVAEMAPHWADEESGVLAPLDDNPSNLVILRKRMIELKTGVLAP